MTSTTDRKIVVPPSSHTRRVFLVAFPVPAILPVEEGVLGRGVLRSATHVEDMTLSDRHLEVHLMNQNPSIAARGRNGVWVEGFRLDEDEDVPIVDGAVIRMGETVLVYRQRYAGGPEPAPPIGSLTAPFSLHSTRELLSALELEKLGAAPRVLIEGETGTGKEGLAREMHLALRPRGPFETFSAAELPKDLCESILFGFAKGAHSKADRSEEGLFRRCHGGTVFLDEIGELPLDLQAKLLRFLQSGEVRGVGEKAVHRVDVAVVSATNQDLKSRVNDGKFRLDLKQRLGQRVALPRLADRFEDIPEILLSMARDKGGTWALERGEGRRGEPRVEAEALERLMLRDFESNVRGLWQVVEAAIRRARAAELRELRERGKEPTEPPPAVLHAWALQPEIEEGTLRTPARALPRALLIDANARARKAQTRAERQDGRGIRATAIKLLGVTETRYDNAMVAAGLDPDR